MFFFLLSQLWWWTSPCAYLLHVVQSAPPKLSIYFPVTFRNGASCNIVKPWSRHSGSYFPSGYELFSCSKDTDVWTHNVFLLLLFICTILVSRNLNHGPNFYCSRLFKCRLKNEHFCKALSVEIDEWVPSTGNNEAVHFCMVARDLGIPCLSHHLLIGGVQRRGWKRLMRYLCKCFSRHEGYPEEEGDLQLGSVR